MGSGQKIEKMGAGVSAVDGGLGLNPEAELGIFVELKQKYEAHDVKTKAEKGERERGATGGGERESRGENVESGWN